MNNSFSILCFAALVILGTSCASKKTLTSVRMELDIANQSLRTSKGQLDDCHMKIADREKTIAKLSGDQIKCQAEIMLKQELIANLKAQIEDLKKQREQQYSQVGDLTVLSKSANENMLQTIKQLENKDQYIRHLQDAKSKADSLNLALAINLKSVLKRGIDDEDIEVKVDKTVVYVNLSDKMMYNSGSANITPRANEVLEKIAQIVKSRPELDVMVEGYTDNNPIKTSCIEDNWDLSVKRATAVIRVLQNNYGINPDKLIAAGRGEYNILADNVTAEGRATNRRTRIIILPRLGQFYDLLNPNNVPKS